MEAEVMGPWSNKMTMTKALDSGHPVCKIDGEWGYLPKEFTGRMFLKWTYVTHADHLDTSLGNLIQGGGGYTYWEVEEFDDDLVDKYWRPL